MPHTSERPHWTTRRYGRARERARLRTLLGPFAAGHGARVLIEGERGTGRTQLLGWLTERTSVRGFPTLHARGTRELREVPLGLLAAAQPGGPTGIDGAELVDGLPVAPEQRLVLLREVEMRLRVVAARRPLVLAIDDLDLADAVTLGAIRWLIPRTAAEPIAWIFTRSLAGPPVEVHRLLAAAADRGLVTVRLDPLGDDAVDELLGDLAGGAPDPALRAAARTMDGLPARVADLVHGLAEEGALELRDGASVLAGDPLPGRLRDEVADELVGLSPVALEMLRTAALMPEGFSVRYVWLLLDHPREVLAAALEELLRCGLLAGEDGLTVRRALVRAVVLDELHPARRRTLTEAFAHRLLDAQVPARDVAELLLRSARPGDALAVEVLAGAAAQVGRTAPDQAIRLLLAAIALLAPDDPERGALVARAIARMADVDDRAGAARLAADALAGDHLGSETRARIRLAMARFAARHDPGEAERQARAGLTLDGLTVGLRAALQDALALALCTAGTLEEVDRLALQVRRSGRAIGSASLQADGLTAHAIVRAHAGDLTTALALTDQAAALVRQAKDVRHDVVLMWQALLTASAGDIAVALARAEAGLQRALRVAPVDVIRTWRMGRARVLHSAGRLRDAEAEALRALGVAALADAPPRGDLADLTVTYVLGHVAAHTGDAALGEQVRVRARRAREQRTAAVARTGAWLLMMLDGEEAGDGGGLAEIAAALEHGGPGVTLAADVAELPRLARFALRAGEPATAERFAVIAEARAAANPELVVVEAAAAHARGLVAADGTELARAAGLLAAEPRPLARAAALEDLADRHGATPAGQVHLSRAYDDYAGAGATADAERVRGKLRSSGVRRDRPAPRADPQGLQALSPAEWPVVELVAAGASNREVAERLYLSPHTVGSHLRSAFAKLGVRSRTELARLVLDRRSEG